MLYEKNEKVLVEIKDGIAVVTMANPPVNSLSVQVMDELEAAFDGLAADNVLAVVIASKYEKAFVAGADISEFPSWTGEDGFAISTKGHRIFQKIANFPAPVICAVNGVAFGGGLELMLSCDIRVIAKNAKIGVPEVTLGIYPGYGGTQRISRLAGAGMAKLMALTGDPITATEAHRVGLCDVLTEVGESFDKAMYLAGRIARAAPIAVRECKYVINKGADLDIGAALALEAERFKILCETEDKNEGAQAFLEKRPPVFQGK